MFLFMCFFRFLSPKGEYLNNKINAVKYLMDSGGSLEEKSLVEEFMMQKTSDVKILRGDINRQKKKNNEGSEPGGSLGGKSMIEEHMMKNDFDEKIEGDDVRGQNKKEVEASQPGSAWMDGGTLLPSGWKMKGEVDSILCRILSPEGIIFQSLRLHLRYMVQYGYTADKVEEVRSKMGLHGWQEDLLLPQGWRFKIKAGHHKNRYCTKEGDIIKGDKNLLSKFKTLENRDIKNFNMFIKKHGGFMQSLPSER